MTEEEKKLLSMCRPEVTLQAAVPTVGEGAHLENDPRNRVFYVAACCKSKGWLEFVRDKEFDQSVFRITQAGAEALAINT